MKKIRLITTMLMRRRFFLLIMVLVPLAAKANGDSVTVSRWWDRLSVGISMGVSYANDMWPCTSDYEEQLSYSGETGRTFGWEGRSNVLTLGYDLSDSWSVGVGICTRRRGLFMIHKIHIYQDQLSRVGGYHDPAWGTVSIGKLLANNWNGAVLDIPLTIEYHKGGFYASGGVIVERGIPLNGPDYLWVPPPYGRAGRTVMKWWHGGAVASVGIRLPLSEHSSIKVGLEASVAVTPYADYAEDWIGVAPADRHYRLYASQNYGFAVGYNCHF